MENEDFKKNKKKDMVGEGVANRKMEEKAGANISDEGIRMGREDKRKGTFESHTFLRKL